MLRMAVGKSMGPAVAVSASAELAAVQERPACAAGRATTPFTMCALQVRQAPTPESRVSAPGFRVQGSDLASVGFRDRRAQPGNRALPGPHGRRHQANPSTLNLDPWPDTACVRLQAGCAQPRRPANAPRQTPSATAATTPPSTAATRAASRRTCGTSLPAAAAEVSPALLRKDQESPACSVWPSVAQQLHASGSHRITRPRSRGA